MKPPKIIASDLSNDQKLHGIIDQLLTEDQLYWRHTRRILKLQLRHQELASEDAFIAYLHLEEAVNERATWMMLLVARWAFEQGKRSSGR